MVIFSIFAKVVDGWWTQLSARYTRLYVHTWKTMCRRFPDMCLSSGFHVLANGILSRFYRGFHAKPSRRSSRKLHYVSLSCCYVFASAIDGATNSLFFYNSIIRTKIRRKVVPKVVPKKLLVKNYVALHGQKSHNNDINRSTLTRKSHVLTFSWLHQLRGISLFALFARCFYNTAIKIRFRIIIENVFAMWNVSYLCVLRNENLNFESRNAMLVPLECGNQCESNSEM